MNLIEYFEKTVDQEKQILVSKNHDYAGKHNQTDDPFYNLKLCEVLGIAPVETGILVRMCDKFARMINYMRTKELKVLDENIDNTISDLRNYLFLLKSWMVTKNPEDKATLEKELLKPSERPENAKELIAELFE